MAHKVDRCDIIDMLEEATKTGGTVSVETSGGQRFSDRVSAVETSDGVDFASFRDHGRVSVDDIRNCEPGPRPPVSYDAKL